MRQREARRAQRAEAARRQRESEWLQKNGRTEADASWEKLERDQRLEALRLAREFTGQTLG